jgi:hypothetical protein
MNALLAKTIETTITAISTHGKAGVGARTEKYAVLEVPVFPALSLA